MFNTKSRPYTFTLFNMTLLVSMCQSFFMAVKNQQFSVQLFCCKNEMCSTMIKGKQVDLTYRA